MTISTTPDGGARSLAASGFDPSSCARVLDGQTVAVTRAAHAADEIAAGIAWRGEAGSAFGAAAEVVTGVVSSLAREIGWLADDARRIAMHAIVDGGMR